MKKTLYAVFIFSLLLGSFGFVSAGPSLKPETSLIGGVIDGESVIKGPMIDEIDTMPRPCKADDYQEVMSVCRDGQLTVSFVKKEDVRCIGENEDVSRSYTRDCYSIVRPPIGGTPIDGVVIIKDPIDEINIRQCTIEDDDYEMTNKGECQSGGTRTITFTKKPKRICKGDSVITETESCEYSGGNIGGGGGGMILLPSNPTVTNPIQQVLGEKVTAVKYIKTPNSSTVYLLDDKNVRHAYPHEKIWYSYFDKDFSFVETITEKELATYPLGRNVTFKAGILMKIPSVPKVYKVADDNGTIQWIKTEEAAIRLYGEDWKNLVKDLSEAFFEDYTLGEDIE
jgi:hypothetical protein